MENTVKIDYFAVTIHDVSPEEVIENILGIALENFSLEPWGVNRYTRHYVCSEIRIYFNENSDSHMGVHIELKGQGCRQYEEFLNGNEQNWVTLVQCLFTYRVNFTRIDIANDIYDSQLSISTMRDYVKRGLCISRAVICQYHENDEIRTGEIVGETLTFGSRANQQWCVYNKLMEQESKGKKNLNMQSWIRAELRCWKEKANIIAKQIKKGRALVEIYFEAVNGHYRFISPKAKDKNKSRRPAVKWWKDYVKTEEKTMLSVKREKTTLERSINWTEHQVSRTLAKIYLAHEKAYGHKSADDYVINLLQLGLNRITESDEKEIEQYSRESQSGSYWGTKKGDLPKGNRTHKTN